MFRSHQVISYLRIMITDLMRGLTISFKEQMKRDQERYQLSVFKSNTLEKLSC